MQSCLQQLRCLKHLRLSGFPYGSLKLGRILTSLRCWPTLQHLDLSDNYLIVRGAEPKELVELLEELTALTSLDLSGIIIDAVRIQDLGHSIAQLPNLQSFTINRGLQEMFSEVFAMYIAQCTALKTFMCSREVGSTKLVQSLSRCQNLEHLELPPRSESCRQAQYSLREVAIHISRMKNLRQLHIWPLISCEEMGSVAQHITVLKALQALSLHQVSLEGGTVTPLATILGALTGLQELYLSVCYAPRQVGDAAAIALAPCLAYMQAMQHLHLDGVGIDAKGVESIAHSLLGMKRLHTLVLSKSRLRVQEAQELAAPISQLQYLRHLDLAWSFLNDYVLLHLADSIGALSNLQSLCMAKYAYGENGMKALASQFSKLTGLTNLDLAVKKTRPYLCAALSPHLGCVTNLQSLRLSQLTKIGEDEGFAEVAAAIRTLTKLILLDLSWCGLKSSLNSFLSEQLTDLISLQNLDVSGNCLGDDGVRALVKSLRVLPVLNIVRFRPTGMSNKYVQEIEACPYASLVLK